MESSVNAHNRHSEKQKINEEILQYVSELRETAGKCSDRVADELNKLANTLENDISEETNH